MQSHARIPVTTRVLDNTDPRKLVDVFSAWTFDGSAVGLGGSDQPTPWRCGELSDVVDDRGVWGVALHGVDAVSG